MATIIAIANNKGGAGKTTLTHNIASGLHRLGHSVLMVDLDAQANLTYITGVSTVRNHVGHLLIEEASWDETVVHLQTEPNQPPLDLLPAHKNLISYETMINHDPNGSILLRTQLMQHEYEYVLIDCPPSLNALTTSALVAATYYIVPIQGETLVVKGLDAIRDLARKVKVLLNPDLRLGGIIKNRFKDRTILGQDVEQALKKDVTLRIFETAIPENVAFPEANAHQQSVFAYAAQFAKSDRSHAAMAKINKLVDEIRGLPIASHTYTPTLLD